MSDKRLEEIRERQADERVSTSIYQEREDIAYLLSLLDHPVSQDAQEVERCSVCGASLITDAYGCDQTGNVYCGTHFKEIGCTDRHDEGCATMSISARPSAGLVAVQVDFTCMCSSPISQGELLISTCDVHRNGRPYRLRAVIGAASNDQAEKNWLAEAERVAAKVEGFRWPNEMSFAEAVIDAIDAARPVVSEDDEKAAREIVRQWHLNEGRHLTGVPLDFPAHHFDGLVARIASDRASVRDAERERIRGEINALGWRSGSITAELLQVIDAQPDGGGK